jgi:hypothetical protein
VFVDAMELYMCAGAIDLLYMSIVSEIAGNETKTNKKQRIQRLCRVLVHGKGPNGHFAVL